MAFIWATPFTFAFHEAAKLGFRYIETDVRATHDGVAVILHDRRLPAQSGLPGAIDRLVWRDARTAELGAGESIPTLEELLVALPAMRINIDIKAESAIEPTVDVIERLSAHARVLVTSFSDRRRRRALRLLLDIGVDGIITDRADLLREVLIARNEWTLL